MQNNLIRIFKATIISLIVALLIVGILLLGIKLLAGQEIEKAILLINKVSIKVDRNEEVELPVIIEEKKSLSVYPEFGTQYGTVEIDRIDVNLPLYYGDSLEILKRGVGHYAGSYFPGEGGSTIIVAHNFVNMFRRFGELEINDEIKITTTYGEYRYRIYDIQIIDETEGDKLPLQRDEEILMAYTCYPFNNIGYTTKRYVLYSKLIEE